MAFPTGQGKMSGVKSDTRGSDYKYSTGVQPNGTPSVGNWNTGGDLVGIGNPSKGREIKPISPPKNPGSIAEAVAGPVRVRKKVTVAPPVRRPGVNLLDRIRWTPSDYDRIDVKGIFGRGTTSPQRPPHNPNQLPDNDAAYDPGTGRYNDYYDGAGPNYRTSSPSKSPPGAKDQSRVPSF